MSAYFQQACLSLSRNMPPPRFASRAVVAADGSYLVPTALMAVLIGCLLIQAGRPGWVADERDQSDRVRVVASFSLHESIAAPAEVVFDVLSDHRGQAKLLSALRSSRIEREGEPPPNGVGAIRALRVVGVTIREQVTVFERPSLFAYKMLSGVPVKAHSATVELAQQGARTALTYRVDSIPKLPVPAAVWVAVVRSPIKRLLHGIAEEAERRARASS